MMPHTKGTWAAKGETLKLEPFQCFITCSLFGWVDDLTGDYRFREAVIIMPRKNGKSPWAAAVGLYKLAADDDYGAEVYSGACTEKQAWEVFKPAKIMAEKTEAFRKHYGIQVNARSVVVTKDGGKFEPVIGKPGDGASVSCGIVDEYHEHADASLYDTFKTGMGARRNPLLLVITTAGSDRSGPCFAAMSDLQKVLEGKIVNDRLFGMVYTIDDTVEWSSELALRMANPNYGVSVSAEYLRDQQREAIQSSRKQNTFKTKNLDIWVSADTSWMNMAAWDRCADPTLSLDDFEGQECYDAVDLASKLDIASKVVLFAKSVDTNVEVADPVTGEKSVVVKPLTHYTVFASHFLNEVAAHDPKRPHYSGWEKDGRITVTPGNVTDYLWIADEVMRDTQRFKVREIPHDPWQSNTLLQTLTNRENWNQNVVLSEVRQDTQNFSPAMKELEVLVTAGRFHHDGDPVLGWMISNVVCHRDARDNLYPRKQREEEKIDGAIALLMALNRALANGVETVKTDVYERRGMRFL